MFRFFNTNSRYPKLATAYRIIMTINIFAALCAGIGAYVYPDNHQYSSKAYFHLVLMYCLLWRAIDRASDIIGDTVVSTADYVLGERRLGH